MFVAHVGELTLGHGSLTIQEVAHLEFSMPMS